MPLEGEEITQLLQIHVQFVLYYSFFLINFFRFFILYATDLLASDWFLIHSHFKLYTAPFPYILRNMKLLHTKNWSIPNMILFQKSPPLFLNIRLHSMWMFWTKTMFVDVILLLLAFLSTRAILIMHILCVFLSIFLSVRH